MAATLRNRLSTALAMCLIAIALGNLPTPVALAADERATAEEQFVVLINRERMARGAGSLTAYWDLVDDARLWSAHQAAGLCEGGATICHNHDGLPKVTTGWYGLGENVGVDPGFPDQRGWETSVTALHAAFMASAGHRANILNPAYDYVGIGIEVSDRGLFVTQVFMDGPGLAVEPKPQLVAPATYSSPERGERPGWLDISSGYWTLAGAPAGFYYGVPSDLPMACDWDLDGTDSVGLYRQANGFLYLRNTNSFGVADLSIFYGIREDKPVCGDWDGDGVETIGVFRPSNSTFYLRNSNTQGFGEIVFWLGKPTDIPLAGDWDGDGKATVAVFRQESQTLYVADPAGRVVAAVKRPDLQIGDLLVAGDFDGDGRDSIGAVRGSSLLVADQLEQTTPTGSLAVKSGAAVVVGNWN